MYLFKSFLILIQTLDWSIFQNSDQRLLQRNCSIAFCSSSLESSLDSSTLEKSPSSSSTIPLWYSSPKALLGLLSARKLSSSILFRSTDSESVWIDSENSFSSSYWAAASGRFLETYSLLLYCFIYLPVIPATYFLAPGPIYPWNFS